MKKHLQADNWVWSTEQSLGGVFFTQNW